MQFLFFDLLAIILGLYSIRNFNIGFLTVLITRICIPSSVRFQLGNLSINFFDLLLLFLIISFIINRPYKKIQIPKNIKLFFAIQIISTFILILFSSETVPYTYQLSSFLKGFILQTYLFILLGFYASYNLKISQTNKPIIVTSIICGIYGIFTYLIKQNPYIDFLSISYTGEENIFSSFMEEIRGGIEGRIYGTMLHPLQWGQFWNILIAYLLLFKSSIKRHILITVFIIGIINIILCGSRTAFVTLIVTLGFYLLDFGFKKMCMCLICGYIFLVTILNVIPKNIQNNGIVVYLQSAVFFWDNSYSEKAGIVGSNIAMRENQLNSAIKIMEKNPIGGVGYNYQYYVAEKGISTDLLGFESIVFKLLVEQGIIGLISFFFVLYLLWKYTMEKLQRNNHLQLINGYFATFIISILFTGMQGQSFIFFICFLFLFISYLDKNPTEHYNKKHKAIL